MDASALRERAAVAGRGYLHVGRLFNVLPLILCFCSTGQRAQGSVLRTRCRMRRGLHVVVAMSSSSPQRQPGRRLTRKPLMVPAGFSICQCLPPCKKVSRTEGQAADALRATVL